jgi:hypothetical protein
MISLVKKLPSEILDLFMDNKNSEKLLHITERKLRPITFLKTDREKIEAFNDLRRSDTNPR